jgi:biotin carboxyl carrier protein
MKVFISYSQKDRRFVKVLSRALEQYSIEIWLDDHRLQIGDSLPHRITAAILDVDFVIVVISPNSIVSKWVYYEMSLTISREKKEKQNHLLPLLLHGVQLPDVIKHRVFADFRGANAMAKSFPKLLKTMGVAAKPAVQYPTAEMVDVTSTAVGFFLANPATKVIDGGLFMGVHLYTDPEGDQTPYVTIGQLVNPETLLGRIGFFDQEIELFAECHGIIEKILVENMQELQYGQVLMVIRKENVSEGTARVSKGSEL